MHRNSFSRRGTILVPASPRSSGSSSSSSSSSRPGRDRALAQHHVEGLLDVVGVELLVEVDDVVLFVFVGRSPRAPRARRERATTSIDVLVDVVDEVVVEHVVVVDEVLFENVLVEVLFVERGLVLEVVVTHSGCLLAGGGNGEQACNRRVATILPTRVAPFGGAEYNAVELGFGDLPGGPSPGRAARTAKGVGGPVGSPLGPLGGPACTRQTGYRNVL